MVLSILRGAFILLVTAVGLLYILPNQMGMNFGMPRFVLAIGGTLFIAAAVVGLDVATKKKRLSALSGIFLGIIAGLVAAYALSFVVELIRVLAFAPKSPYLNLLPGVKVMIGLITCYLGISFVLQTKDDFRFVIPYVELAKQVRGHRPTVVDTSVLIDGRILDIVRTRVIQGVLVVPQFVLTELHAIADSADKLKRTRGRRGLDMLQQLQDNEVVEVWLDHSEAQGLNVDQKLIALGEQNQWRIMTNDMNLNKIATLRGVEVINLNDLAKAMRPVVLPGEEMAVKLVKPGESSTQGVGFLDDGTMVVVEGGRKHLGQAVDLVVTSTLQTSAGRMIFGRFDSEAQEGETSAETPRIPPTTGAAAGAGGAPPDQAKDQSKGERSSREGSSAEVGAGAGGGEVSSHSRKPARRRATGRNPRRSR